MIVLDTHAWVFWVNGSKQLSRSAAELVRSASESGGLYVSSISVWEIALLERRGRLELTMEMGDWIARSEALPFLNFVPVDNRIALRSIDLPGSFHDDPADRIIVATALSLGATVVTRDRRIRAYPHVKTAW